MCELRKYHKTSNTQIDKCMRKFISGLNNLLKNNGIKHIDIIACCCGHKKYPMTIIVKNKTITCSNGKKVKKGYIWDLVSGKEIPRTRRFYKRDKQGYYYIPEVLENG